MIIVAHRGDQEKFPENSYRAILSSIKKQCSFEIDIQYSSDNIAFLEHDKTLYRNYKLKRTISSLSSHKLIKLGLPTLKCIINVIPPNYLCFFELKSKFTAQIGYNIHELSKLVNLNKCCWITEYGSYYDFFQYTNISHGWIIDKSNKLEHDKLLSDKNSLFLIVSKDQLNKVTTNNALNIDIIVYTINTRNNYEKVLINNSDIKGIITDKLHLW